MRNYLVYIKTDECWNESMRSTQTYVTPCFAVDKLFWKEQEQRKLYVIGSSSSLALAFAIREQVNRHIRNSAFTEKTVDDLRSIASGFVRETNRLYGQQFEDQNQSVSSTAFALQFQKSAMDDQLMLEPDQIVREADQLYEGVAGRALFVEEIERLAEKRGQQASVLDQSLQWLVLQGKVEIVPGVRLEIRRGVVRHSLIFTCQRCGSNRHINPCTCYTCCQSCAYCTACLEMGRSKSCTPYVCTPMPERRARTSESGKRPLQWTGSFSAAQAIAAERARCFVAEGNKQEKFLIWAVCGAGKTELIFPAIDEALSSGGQVLVATPRKDVVLELTPRLARAFPTTKVIAVHGFSLEKWEDAQLIISTTHQVMRFYRRFALVIVDEVDAFPYRGDEMLYRAVQRSVADKGKQLFLSATPPAELTKKLVGKTIFRIAPVSKTHVMLPLRYHGHPLPVPEIFAERRLEQKLRNGMRMERFLKSIIDTIDANRQLFLFVPRIEWIELVLRYVSRFLPGYEEVMAGVHAADSEREQKVTAFREKRLKLIVTTTILERGVTIPRSDVIVLGADAGVFDEASLVQIAGRVGRSADAPDGMVRFILAGSSRAPYDAIKQIKRMNRLGFSSRKEQMNHAT